MTHTEPNIASLTLDLCHLTCPLPILKAKKAIKQLPSGCLLTVLATDPSAEQDFKEFCSLTGNNLESHSINDGLFTFHIRVK